MLKGQFIHLIEMGNLCVNYLIVSQSLTIMIYYGNVGFVKEKQVLHLVIINSSLFAKSKTGAV